MKKPNYYHRIVQLLHKLQLHYPSYNMGRHLSTALDEYGDVWGLSDKELLFAFEKYVTQLEIDFPHTDEDEIENIIRDGMDLDNILKEEDNVEDY